MDRQDVSTLRLDPARRRDGRLIHRDFDTDEIAEVSTTADEVKWLW